MNGISTQGNAKAKECPRGRQRVSGVVQKAGVPIRSGKSEWRLRALSLVCGAVLGLSAPGLEQWYLPWFWMSTLLLLTIHATEPWKAGVRAFYFGLGYNLIYISWICGFRAVYSEGVFSFVPAFVALTFWLLLSMRQALYLSIFSCVLKALPLTGGFVPVKEQGKWLAPCFVVAPLLWVVLDRLCNLKELAGVPWALLEYSQYRQPVLLQSASIFGGVGLSACMILANCALVAALTYGRKRWRPLTFASPLSLVLNSLVALSLLSGIIAFGSWRLSYEQSVPKKMITVSAIQSGLSEKVNNVGQVSVFRKHLDLCAESPCGSMCVWPEWGMPVNFSSAKATLEIAAGLAAQRNQTWIVGLFDQDNQERKFNSVCAIEPEKVAPQVYHKQYLVPIGEFTPDFVRNTPIGTIMYGFNKRYNDTSPGHRTVVFPLASCQVIPLLCFENLIPHLAAEGVRAGGNILVDCSDTTWFEKSILGDQMLAFCVMRSVEMHRSFVFATVYGPSAIVDSTGQILKVGPREVPALLTADVPVESDITPFARWSF